MTYCVKNNPFLYEQNGRRPIGRRLTGQFDRLVGDSEQGLVASTVCTFHRVLKELSDLCVANT